MTASRRRPGGTEDAYAMGELAKAWTIGFQSPRPSLLNASQELLQGIITLKHVAVNSLENTFPWTRHNFDANASFGVDPFVLADYYLVPFQSAIAGGGARGIMCSYNAVLVSRGAKERRGFLPPKQCSSPKQLPFLAVLLQGKPTCLSPLIRNARRQWNFQGYVTSDSDSVANAYSSPSVGGGGHGYPAGMSNDKRKGAAVALALKDGQCDVNSGDSYNSYLLDAVAAGKKDPRPVRV